MRPEGAFGRFVRTTPGQPRSHRSSPGCTSPAETSSTPALRLVVSLVQLALVGQTDELDLRPAAVITTHATLGR